MSCAGRVSYGFAGAVLTAGVLILATLALVGLTKVGLLLGTLSVIAGTVLLTSPGSWYMPGYQEPIV